MPKEEMYIVTEIEVKEYFYEVKASSKDKAIEKVRNADATPSIDTGTSATSYKAELLRKE